jgi:hypothetical protein
VLSRLSIDVHKVKCLFTHGCFLQAIMGLGLSFSSHVVCSEMNWCVLMIQVYTQVRHVTGSQFCSFIVSQFHRVVISVV